MHLISGSVTQTYSHLHTLEHAEVYVNLIGSVPSHFLIYVIGLSQGGSGVQWMLGLGLGTASNWLLAISLWKSILVRDNKSLNLVSEHGVARAFLLYPHIQSLWDYTPTWAIISRNVPETLANRQSFPFFF